MFCNGNGNENQGVTVNRNSKLGKNKSRIKRNSIVGSRQSAVGVVGMSTKGKLIELQLIFIIELIVPICVCVCFVFFLLHSFFFSETQSYLDLDAKLHLLLVIITIMRYNRTLFISWIWFFLFFFLFLLYSCLLDKLRKCAMHVVNYYYNDLLFIII